MLNQLIKFKSEFDKMLYIFYTNTLNLIIEKPYWIINDAIIFRPGFDESLDNYLDVISNYPILIFSNFNDPHIALKNNNKYSSEDYYSCVGSIFNQPLIKFHNFLSNTNTNTNINLQRIIFGERFNQPLDDTLSNLVNLRELTFGNHFNHPLGDSLSNLHNLRKLTFDEMFNQPIDNCLSNLVDLEELTFGEQFDQPLNDTLTHLSNLEKLTFGYCFNQPLDNTLSNLVNLRELTLGNYFNQSIDIPDRIKKLTLYCNSQSIIDYLPSNIEELELGYSFKLELNNLPNSSKKIKILNQFYDKKLNNLPNQIETLVISPNYKVRIDREYKSLNIVYL